jgi:hypothetical protein
MTNLIYDAYDNYPEKQKDSKKINNSLTPYEFYLSACELSTGQHGSFAEAIGDAYIVADKGNSQKLLDAFPELFLRGWHWVQSKRITQTGENQDA